jgi:hypothetical protein
MGLYLFALMMIIMNVAAFGVSSRRTTMQASTKALDQT